MLLAAALSIPNNARVAAAHFVPQDPLLAATPDVLELARRRLANSSSFFNTPLPSVQLGGKPALHVFSILSPDTVNSLDDLSFDGLVAASTPASQFPFQMIYEQPHFVISHFLHAVRTRLIDNIAAANPSVQRCKDGFLISHHSPTAGSTDWGTGWEYKALSRPLIFCYIQLQPTPSAILIRPTLLPTPYLPLDSCLPLLPRSPILLLPYATPAYFLTTYSGPTSVLTRQFAESLQGHGQPSLGSSFVIGWISVENRRGEDKGVTFIYPARLCLAFLPALNRPLLDYTPDLPGPLQPSPKLQSATSPLTESFPEYPHRPSLLGSPSTELKTFHALSLSKSKNIRAIAAQISSYVDHVAKDRERERERLKREREGGTSPSLLPRTTPSTSTAILPATPSAPPPLAVHTPTPTQTVVPPQNFYPSPPQVDTTTAPIPGNTSPVLSVAPQPPTSQVPSSSPASAQPPPLSSSSSSSYDPFGYLDIGMDFGMDVGMNFSMSMNLGGSSSATSNEAGSRSSFKSFNDDPSRGVGLGGSSGMDFEDFTDDDFNFFDQPSVHAPPQPQLATSSNIPLSNPSQVTSPPLFGDAHLPGPGPPHPTPHTHPTPAAHLPWSSNFPEGFTPRSVEHMDSVVPSELLPPPPGLTPLTVSENQPIAPRVHLEQDGRSRTPEINTDESRRTFDPIPFARSHRLADGKYAPTGKFGLPSPPPDEPDAPPVITPVVRGQSPVTPRPQSGRIENTFSTAGWWKQYKAKTDPRIGVVRKLIGVKRRYSTQGGRTGKDVRKSPWTTEHEEWTVHRSPLAAGAKDLESETSEDEVSPSEDEFSEEEDTPATSRPSTPPPSYLPLGSTLIHTQFQHSQLLPLSKPLRPPGSSISGPSTQGSAGAMPMPIANVPTPVSPAAGLGLSVEKWRALEAAVNLVAKEVVENPVWRDTWMTGNVSASAGAEARKHTEIWPRDVKVVEKVLGNLEGVKGGLGVDDIFGSDSVITTPGSLDGTKPLVHALGTPKLSVAKSGAILNVLPPALRFWEKLGLGPKSGEKDATVFALYADEGVQYRQAEVASWLGSICAAYETKHLGKLVLGTNPHCRDGLFSLKFDLSFRKAFATFAGSLPNASTPILLFLVVPIHLMSLSSLVLRQVLSSMQKALKSFPDNQVLVQLVPEHVISYMESDAANANQLESLCVNLYNRILISADRPLARVFSPDSTPVSVKTYIQAPIFTLARPLHNRVTYAKTAHASLDVLDRYTLLHVGYRISACRKWVMAACVDQRGEAWDQAVWLMKNDQHDVDGEGVGSGTTSAVSVLAEGNHEEALVAKKVWDFVSGFARRADVEWRIVISKLGVMSEAELTVWTALLPTVVPTSGLGAVQISLVCADPDSPWMFTHLDANFPNPHTTTSPPNGKHVVFSDVSSTTYALFSSVVLPIATPPTQTDLGLSLPYVVDPSNTSNGLADADMEDEATSPMSTTIATPATVSVPTSPLSPLPVLVTGSMPHPVGLLPKSTTCLVRVPRFSQPTSISMLHIHLLSTYCFPPSLAKRSSLLGPTTVHADVTKNFYELSVLAHSRWKMSAPEVGGSSGNTADCGNVGMSGVSKTDVNPTLPLHLATVDLMNRVIEGADGIEIDC